ncbi:hypothetical protein FWD20_00940 [Candidatus Saccharibacteria bacterium]|nr:hypothetical protein [Candidatus Saccharibacteria bacterium]
MSPDVGGEAETAETTPREHLNWAIKRALELYDAGQKENAVKSFMSDMTKHPGTAFIAAKPFSLMLVQTGCNTSRQEFQNMMAGFKL